MKYPERESVRNSSTIQIMKNFRNRKMLQRAILGMLIPAFAMVNNPVQANPRGGVVVHGNVDINRISAKHLKIHQKSQMAVINWNDFSIGAGELTRFAQPNRNASVLNRVTSGNVTGIYGQLKGNGNVFVINPNGIVIGSTGVVDVAGNAVLSTLDIDDSDFLNGGANRFYGNSTTGVTNFGTISSSDGDVILLGGFVDNQGQIGALNGTVAIGSGGDILVSEGAGSKISIQGGSSYKGTGINNDGTIRGASAELKAHGNVYALAINNGGAIRASGASRSNGRVRLQASGGSSSINLGNSSNIVARSGNNGGDVSIESTGGDVAIGGRIDAAGTNAGGSVSVVGNSVTQAVGSEITASGGSDGGSIRLDAADSMVVNAEVSANGAFGDGGDVTVTGSSILISDAASLSADGMTRGGSIRVGGDFQGRDVAGLREADSVSVEAGAQFSADSDSGDAGSVIVWSNEDTVFFGDVSASAHGAVGNGGFIEISGAEYLQYDGGASATSANGQSGTVLFDPGTVIIGDAGSTVTVASINTSLQGGTNVLISTESGNIVFDDIGLGGPQTNGNALTDRDSAIQWTNSAASFGAFASGSILVNNHIRTSGAGSINLIAGWTGSESDSALSFTPEAAWDFYIPTGQFGQLGGSVIVGSEGMNRHVEVGSRFGNTNIAGFDIRVRGSDVSNVERYAMIGFKDGGQVFAPRLNNGNDAVDGGIVLDMIDGSGNWILSDGVNGLDQDANGVYDPVVAVAGKFEVDMNGDGINDGVHGIDSTGERTDTFIPYANHYNSSSAGNWWWQQIEDSGNTGPKDTHPDGLGGLRPENGAGTAANGADINLLATGNVIVQGGSGRDQNAAMIGHGGPNVNNWGGGGISQRDIGDGTATNPNFSIRSADNQSLSQYIERGQMERRWSFNGANSGRIGTSIARLAPVYGNINVYAGVDTAVPINVDRSAGTVTATVGTTGSVILSGNQDWETGSLSSNSFVQIGHGGVGQFGEFYGDIYVEAAADVLLQAGTATRSHAAIGHTVSGYAYWNPPSNADQQLRFFATAGDFDNPNLRRGELFSGEVTTGFDPGLDPSKDIRYTLADYTIVETSPGVWEVVVDPGNTGNYVPIIDPATGIPVANNNTARHENIHTGTEIEFNPLLYTRGNVNPNGGTDEQGANALAPLELAPISTAADPVIVEALEGATVKGMHGDVTVIARNGEVVVAAGNSPDDTSLLINNDAVQRDTRFAQIGHGGRNFELGRDGLGSGYRGGLNPGNPPGPTDNTQSMEDVRFQIANQTDGTLNPEGSTGGLSTLNTGGSTLNRNVTFMGITGDIRVESGGDTSVLAGNDIYDYAQIGHGGSNLTDYETSSFILGDVQLDVGGDFLVRGGGFMLNEGRRGNTDIRAWAQIGHGGYRSGFFAFNGDIGVDVEGDLTVTGGAYAATYAQIGHQGYEAWGQSGGEFSRIEHFVTDRASAYITSTLDEGEATVDYEFTDADGNVTVEARSFDTAGTSLGGRSTADISVNVGGDIQLNHLQDGKVRNWRSEQRGEVDPDNESQGLRTRKSQSQIGHGGVDTHAFRYQNQLGNYGNKVGNITVEADGDIVMENAGELKLVDDPFDPTGPQIEVRGGGTDRWTRIGHGVGGSEDRVDGRETDYATSTDLAGNITVIAGRDILVDASAADSNENPLNTDALAGSAAPSDRNPVSIGHGALIDALDVVVLGNGELVNGIAASSNIAVTAARDLTILGGKGTEGSTAQIGHGFGSDLGNDASRRLNVYTGFTGDINVHVGRDLLMESGQQAWAETPSDIDGRGDTIAGAFAAIGNGGYQIDAPANGDITVYVGGDAILNAQQREQEGTDTAGGGYVLVNQDPGASQDYVASVYNFVTIGHVNAENGNRVVGTGDQVRNADQSGDINVVVANDLTLQGGTTPDMNTQPIYGAFAQIGNGGSGIGGDLTGSVSVLVGQDLFAIGGTDNAGSAVTINPNNYTMIGNGDWIFDASNDANAVFRTGGNGFYTGDINVATGRHANFDRVLVGHGDPEVSNLPIDGTTRVAVSRSNPFYGGEGLLTAENGSVFTSGYFGFSSQVQFFAPARSNNLMDVSTRINVNELNNVYESAPLDFLDPFPREDEVYLTPDLWWDEEGIGNDAGFPNSDTFPSDATSGQGGGLALVDSPGGLFNLSDVVPGDLGGSVASASSGLYTIYYDATEPVSNELPVPPEVPTPVPPVDTPKPPREPKPPGPFDFTDFTFLEQFESFDRNDGAFEGVLGENLELAINLGTEESVEAIDDFRRRLRKRRGSELGVTYWIFEPGTNRYSSYRVFGIPSS